MKDLVVVGAKKPKEFKKVTIKERLENKYSFRDDLVKNLFEDLSEQKLIALPEVKRPHKVGKTNDPKYCPYHCLIRHPINECFVLKDNFKNFWTIRLLSSLLKRKHLLTQSLSTMIMKVNGSFISRKSMRKK